MTLAKMPVIHKNWDILKAKVEQMENVPVRKRFLNKLVVFSVEEPKFDPNIPIITEYQLDRWKDPPSEQPTASTRQDKPVVKQKASPVPLKIVLKPHKLASKQHENVSTEPHDGSKRFMQKEKVYEKAAEKIARKLVEKVKEKRKKKAFEREAEKVRNATEIVDKSGNHFRKQEDDGDVVVISDELNISQKAAEESPREEAFCEGNIDRLITREQFVDEFKDYDDESDDTPLSKNLKKIRLDVPHKPKPKDANRPVASTSKSNNRQTRSISLTSHRLPTIGSPHNPVDNINAFTKPQTITNIANWADVAKNLQQNKFHAVYSELNHFKADIVKTSEAKSIAKDAVRKSIQEDQTKYLIDFLNLLYEINYNDDPEFWSEVIHRLKKKLSPHSKVKQYKGETNADWVHQNYQTAMLSISEYAKAVDNCLVGSNFPYSTMIFLIDPLNKHEILCPNHSKTNGNIMSEKKPDISKVKFELGENSNPDQFTRQVTYTRDSEGKPFFKIVNNRINNSLPTFSKRLL